MIDIKWTTDDSKVTFLNRTWVLLNEHKEGFLFMELEPEFYIELNVNRQGGNEFYKSEVFKALEHTLEVFYKMGLDKKELLPQKKSRSSLISVLSKAEIALYGQKFAKYNLERFWTRNKGSDSTRGITCCLDERSVYKNDFVDSVQAVYPVLFIKKTSKNSWWAN